MNKCSSETYQARMFYDGQCPLCKREVAHYRNLDKNKHINWIDISSEHDKLQQYNIDYDTAMSRLHVINSDGHMQSGVLAFLTVWDSLPYYRWLAVFVRCFKLTPMLEWLYVRFARWRLARQNRVHSK